MMKTTKEEIKTTWFQRDGTPIKIKDMSDSHLYNTIKMLERLFKQYSINLGEIWAIGSMLQGEMAQMAFEEDFDRLLEEEVSIDRRFPSYPYLIKEAKRRKLAIE
jgi:hypothetical protein